MDPQGPEIVISGFNDSIDKVSIALFEKIRDFNPLSMKEQFVHLREAHLKDLRNFYRNQPYQQAYTFTSCMLKKGGGNFLPEEEIEALENISFEDLVHFHENFFKTTRLEGLFVGNMTQDQVVHVSENIEKIVTTMRGEGAVLPREDIPEVRAVNLKTNTTWFFEHVSKNSEVQHVEPNSSLMSVFQFEEETPFLRVLMSILGNYLKEPCFDKLRTDEQLGYIVSGFNGEMRKVLNYVVIVQSNVQGPQYLSGRVLNFLDTMREKIKSLTDEEFAKYVESIRVKILIKDLSIRQEGSRYWNEICTHKYIFDRKEKDLEQLNLIKKEDLIWIFEEMFYNNRKLFETHMVSQNHVEENEKLKTQRLQEKSTLQALSPAWFKRRMPLHPDFASML
jgi:insulysin